MTKNESLEPKKEQKLFMAKLPSDIESMTPEQIKEISTRVFTDWNDPRSIFQCDGSLLYDDLFC